jgi:hypothetical protein
MGDTREQTSRTTFANTGSNNVGLTATAAGLGASRLTLAKIGSAGGATPENTDT